ncbi:MAG: hypothetical protein J6Y66_07920 [Bacteroidales bacterium]|nr:hypothetical protein [Bacteroidales bacterium]
MSYYSEPFVRQQNKDAYYRSVYETQYLGYTRSCIKPKMCLLHLVVPSKNIDIIIVNVKEIVDSQYEKITLFTGDNSFQLEKLNVDKVKDATLTDFDGLIKLGRECCLFVIDFDIFKKVCASNSLNIRMENADASILSWNNDEKYFLTPYMKTPSKISVLTYFRAVYNEFCDKDAYKECREKVEYSFFQRLKGWD